MGRVQYVSLDNSAHIATTPVHATGPTRPPRPSPPGGDETILLVEDEVAVLRVTARLLAHLGYRVLQAAHGAEALAIARAEHDTIDLLLTDVLMPEMNGVTLARDVQSLRPEIRVLYMSGYTADVLQSPPSGQRAAQLVQKPFARDTMARAIRRALE
jgi:two-component system cell cycle sensor histidine kinase/response regulator CckA